MLIEKKTFLLVLEILISDLKSHSEGPVSHTNLTEVRSASSNGSDLSCIKLLAASASAGAALLLTVTSGRPLQSLNQWKQPLQTTNEGFKDTLCPWANFLVFSWIGIRLWGTHILMFSSQYQNFSSVVLKYWFIFIMHHEGKKLFKVSCSLSISLSWSLVAVITPHPTDVSVSPGSTYSWDLLLPLWLHPDEVLLAWFALDSVLFIHQRSSKCHPDPHSIHLLWGWGNWEQAQADLKWHKATRWPISPC